VVDPGSAERRAIGEAVDLGSGRGEVRGSVLALGSGLAAAGGESWGAAGGGGAALGQAWGVEDGVGGGLAVVGPGQGGGDAVRRMGSATKLGQTKMQQCRKRGQGAVRGAVRCRGAAQGTREKRKVKLLRLGCGAGRQNDARRCARRAMFSRRGAGSGKRQDGRV
jgi:hypothetical protein